MGEMSSESSSSSAGIDLSQFYQVFLKKRAKTSTAWNSCSSS